MNTVLALGGLGLSAAAGATLGWLLRIPLWAFTGSLFGAAVFSLSTGVPDDVPRGWAIAAQVLIGCAVGSQLDLRALRDFRRVLVAGAVSVLAIVGVGLLLGLALSAAGWFDPATALFGFVPGGVGEMVAAAEETGGDSSMVATLHLLRLLAVLALLPAAIMWARRLRG